ncbi:PfkB family carbohydrate kinase [Bifidobacterium sp. ESL0775]|uniref:PfkB family carbohydrate kinase n=1 Tax=Bifidobacterium sp. ESL0775 TaxID=2983230 RepID=UPI0023F76897|nr:PfkB family carbohydrate kinase [Bifidobacterium sp. ESL0775]WEV69167.1 PfkB family carbohydrate kinase [Bifidobacterium sp. ESL0775]
MVSNKKVLGLGDQVVDEYVNLNVMYPGGNAMNFAAFAKKLGYDSAFMGVFGDDKQAQHVKDSIDKLGIDRSHSRTEHGENGCAKVNIVNGDRVFVGSNEGGVAGEKPLQLDDDDIAYLKTFSLIHMGIWGHCDHLLPRISELGIPISYDFSDEFTNDTLQGAIGYVQYGFFSVDMPDNQVQVLLKHIFSPSNKVLMATRGSRSTIVYDGKDFREVAPHVVKAVDTMAAGDSFLTAFLLSREIEGKGMKESMEDGQRFAAQAVQLDGSFGFGTQIE